MSDDEGTSSGNDDDWKVATLVSNPDEVGEPHGDVPDWYTDMDQQILYVLKHGHVLTPAVIAQNIDRSRGGVSNRLQTLQAGGFVEKVDRGKYSITKKGYYTATGIHPDETEE